MTVAAGTVEPREVLDQAIAALNKPGSALPLEDVDRALTVTPQDARLWHVKGLIHRHQDRRELALPALQRAAELAPGEPLIAHGYARTLLEAGQPAVDAFARVMKLAPNNPDVVKGMISALVAEARIGDAIAGLELALARSPLWTDGHKLMASLRWAEGERAGFTRSFDQALEVNPTSVELRREQLNLLMHAEQWDDALGHIEAARRALGEHALVVGYEAFVRSEMGEVDAADRLFALLPSGIAEIDVWRVRHLLRARRPSEAAQAIDPWLETPDQLMFWHYAATAWRQTDDPRREWLEGDSRFVGIYDLADRLPPLDALSEQLRQRHTLPGQLIAQSVRGGTQTDGNLFQRIEPIIVKLRETIREVVAEHARQLPPADPNHPLLGAKPDSIEFTGAWSVRLQPGGLHANHVHPFGWLSSALYIVLPPDLGRDQAGWFTLGEPDARLGLDLPPTRMIEPKAGRLVLFPSWMWHGTRPFSEGERLTVAFDVARGPVTRA